MEGRRGCTACGRQTGRADGEVLFEARSVVVLPASTFSNTALVSWPGLHRIRWTVGPSVAQQFIERIPGGMRCSWPVPCGSAGRPLVFGAVARKYEADT